MNERVLISFIMLFSVNFIFAQFESAKGSAYFTEDLQTINQDSIKNQSFRKVEVKIENLDSLSIHGVIIEVLEAESDYIMSRKIGNKYKEGTMDFISYQKGVYIINVGFFKENAELKLLLRLEDYKRVQSQLFTLIVKSYEK